MSTDVTAAPPPGVLAPPSAPLPSPPAGSLSAAPALVIDGQLHVPAGINDLEAFRCWARSEACPERVRAAYLAGTLWLDRTMEQLYTHNQVKEVVTRVLGNLTSDSKAGLLIPDGMLLSNAAADLSTVPDALFAFFDTLRAGRLCQVAGRRTGVVELEGTPDMVLEVVSDSSVEKDMVHLPVLYFRAGVPEFWRVDARGEELLFEILRREATAYAPANEADGWWRSAVFGRSFRLTQQANPLGQPSFSLEHRL